VPSVRAAKLRFILLAAAQSSNAAASRPQQSPRFHFRPRPEVRLTGHEKVLPSVAKIISFDSDVSLFGAEGIVLQTNRIAYLIEEPSRLRGGFHFVILGKIKSSTVTVWSFHCYSKTGGDFATEIGSIKAT
jgi:hypothetical protein